MGETILYSNLQGTFLFNLDLSIKDKIIFKTDKEVIEASKKLSKGLWTDSENKIIKSNSGDKITYIGFKEEANKGVSYVQLDIGRLRKIYATIKKTNPYSVIYKNSIIITKDRIKTGLKRDFFILQAINNIDETDKVANLLVKRLREWYGVYSPEFTELMQDNEKFVQLILEKDRQKLQSDLKISEKDSMGAEVSKSDLIPILDLAKNISQLYVLRSNHEKYLDKLMNELCPNITTITGSLIGAKLISSAGSLRKLSGFPASTIQILGAEKALFRHLKTGARSPKHGIIFQHPFIAKAEKAKRGKVARTLADKITIAAKVDYFKGDFVGDMLRKQIEKKLSS